jgi:hypothetical protein
MGAIYVERTLHDMVEYVVGTILSHEDNEAIGHGLRIRPLDRPSEKRHPNVHKIPWILSRGGDLHGNLNLKAAWTIRFFT